jgi:hypothetical protein
MSALDIAAETGAGAPHKFFSAVDRPGSIAPEISLGLQRVALVKNWVPVSHAVFDWPIRLFDEKRANL